MTTYLRGIWGSPDPAQPVPTDQDASIDILLAGPGQYITFINCYGYCIFTPGSNQPNYIQNPWIYNVLSESIKVSVVGSIMLLLHAISATCSESNGREYIIYNVHSPKRDQNRPRRGSMWGRTIDHALEVLGMLAEYSKPMPVLRISSGIAQEVQMSYMQLTGECGRALNIRTRNVVTRVYSKNGRCGDGRVCTMPVRHNPKSAHKFAVAMRKFASVSKTDPIYVFSINAGNIIPRVHVPHLSLLSGRFLADVAIEVYAAGEHIAAAEDQIKYDDTEPD